MTSATRTKTPTIRQIKNLRRESARALDLGLTHACDVALGTEYPITTSDAWEERYGGSGASAHELETVMSIESRDDALSLIADALSD